jgi:DNA-binding NarL/FixJ family response regulator
MQIPGSLPHRFAAGGAPPPGVAGLGDGLGREPPLGRRVAIVEDEMMVAWSLRTMVEDLGYEMVGTFPRGEAALAAIAPDGVDIVLMDINLGGGMDGVETARRLRASGDVRILFISAYADPATRARVAAEVPGALLLRKPVSAARLAQALDPRDAG